MITPEYLEYTLDILQVHKELQESIIRDIVRRMLKHPERLTDTAEWQLEKVQQSGILYNELVRELSRATGRLEGEIRAAFDDAEGRIFDYGDKTVAAAGFDPVEFKSLSPSMKQTWEAALSKTSTEAVNLTKTTAVTAQSSYIRACDLAHMQVASGAFDYNTAIRNAVKYAAGQGVTVVYPSGYVDKLDTAIRRSLLTGINQTAGQLQNMRADSLDCDIMEITAHAGARPAHAVWQGQLVSRSGRRGYLSLSDIGYGSVTGFMGANCRHNWHMFFEGISERAYTDAQLAALNSETVEYNGERVPLWKATDYQRRLERSVKASKRELVALDEAIKNANGELKTGLQADFEHAAQLLKKREAKLKDLCNQTGLYYDSTRCGVFSVKTENGIKSWGRSAAQKAVAANKKALTVNNIGDIIKAQGGKIMSINNIDSPIEQRNTAKGNPNAILQIGRPLNKRQQRLLNDLKEYDSSVTVKKKNVSMKDLSALTAITGDEFALFTKGKERLVIRGNSNSVNIDVEKAVELSKQGYKWSGHTHPGIDKNCLIHSPGDALILKAFGQNTSVIYNSKGQFELFKGGY